MIPAGTLLLSFLGFLALFGCGLDPALALRISDQVLDPSARQQLPPTQPLRSAVFALGSFWRSEATFGCVPGVVRTSVGYASGSKPNPEYRNLGDHAECVKVEYDPKIIQFKQLLDVFWASHDSRQVFGQGPDVGRQYRSIIFTNGTIEARLASFSKEREQAKSRNTIVTTEIQPLGIFYPAEPEHQKFELKRNKFLLQLMGNMPDEELISSSLAAKLNGYVAELCLRIFKRRSAPRLMRFLRTVGLSSRDSNFTIKKTTDRSKEFSEPMLNSQQGYAGEESI
uniref:Peptide methionine sulfoxide reductase A5 n=1 Tax=Ananas comosus var. bracteatus TaxID=296719 RepID=A0A6V7PHF6_ANACO|nr:unnamed protein product [Ananas comosus var. bracteatus]